MSALKDASSEQRSRVKEIVQSSLNDGALKVEFAIKEKNRRILVLEDERRGHASELAALSRSLAAAQATLRAAMALLQRLLDILDERNRAGRVDLGNSDAYGDLWEDARICLARTTDLLAQHDKEQQPQQQKVGGSASGAQKRSKRR